MKRTGVWGSLLLLVASLGLTACASMRGEPTPSLYRRVGGREGIAGVVDGFVTNALADPRIGPAFKALRPPRSARSRATSRTSSVRIPAARARTWAAR